MLETKIGAKIGGYMGRFLRVDLTNLSTSQVKFDESTLRTYIGGAGIGIKILYDEVLGSTDWSDPENRLILASGPVNGTIVGGSGSYCIVTKGPLTNGAASVQANGFFGAYMKLSGFDGIIIQGRSKNWVYLTIADGKFEFKDAEHLLGKDTRETENLVKQELRTREKQASVACIGPAGESLVRYAGIFSDMGHAAPHNGVGAVMGSKKLKAIAVKRGTNVIPIRNLERLKEVSKEFLDDAKKTGIFKWGTLLITAEAKEASWLPVKNYTTNIWDIDEEHFSKFEPEYITEHCEPRANACWACQASHCNKMSINEGPYKGLEIEEPEYEQIASWSSVIGQNELSSTMMLCNLVDRLGMDTNEAGWVVSWVMECYEKGLITEKDLGGLEARWGDSEFARTLLQMIAGRKGFGNILAEGVMRAAQHVGGEARNLAIHTMKGDTPRGHDHRTRWHELFDTCVSSTGTIETHVVGIGMKQYSQPGNPLDLARDTAVTKGVMQIQDSLVACQFNVLLNLKLMSQAISAVTGWDISTEEAMTTGKRIVNLFRAFNIRCGLSPELERPSPRYGSTPIDGPWKGTNIMEHWGEMIETYYKHMGWDRVSGKPLPQTLRSLGLDRVVEDLWGNMQ